MPDESRDSDRGRDRRGDENGDEDRRRRRSRSDSRERRSDRKHRHRSRSRSGERRSSKRHHGEERSSRHRSLSRSRSRSRGRSPEHKSKSPPQVQKPIPSSTTTVPGLGMTAMPNTAPAAAAAAQNPAAIAMAAARSLGMQASAAVAGAGGGGMGGGAYAPPVGGPNLMAQMMAAGRGAMPGMPGTGGIPGMGGMPMGMGVGDKTSRELFVGNTPQGTSDFVLLEFLNAAMKQVNLATQPGNPVIGCRVNNKYAFIELRSAEECSKAISLNGIPFMGQMLKIGRPSKYQGPATPSSTWQQLTGQTPSEDVVDPSTKMYRELYVGNTTTDMTDMVLKEFLGTTMGQVGLTKEPGNPIIQARVSGSFAFVECRSVEEATSLLSLNGIPFMGQVLKINRPAKYPGPETPHLNWNDILARYTGEVTAQAVGAPTVDPTRSLRLSNMLTDDDLKNEEDLGEVEEETKEECEKFGKVSSVHIPRPSTTNATEKAGVGFVFVQFEDTASAASGAASLRGRTFDGRKVEVTYWDDQKFTERVFTADGNAEIKAAEPDVA